MSNLVSLCQQIEEFLRKNDSHTIEQFLHWIEQRFHDRSLINTSQFFNCQCGHRYSLRFQLLDNHNEQNQIHDCEERKLDELQSLEQLIPPDTTEPSNTARMTQFGLPKLTDSMVEIIHSDGKRQFRCPLCFNSYVNRSGLNRHYITHSSQDLWKVECQFCGKRYSRKDSLKHHIKTQHTQFVIPHWIWKEKSNHLSNESEPMDNNNDDVVLVT